MKVILDTGIVSRYLSNNTEVVKIVSKFPVEDIYISVVSFIELSNWLSNYTNLSKKDRQFLKKTISKLNILHINTDISKLAFEFSLKHVNDKAPDLLIAATGKHYGYDIVTLNTKDFKKFK